MLIPADCVYVYRSSDIEQVYNSYVNNPLPVTNIRIDVST